MPNVWCLPGMCGRTRKGIEHHRVPTHGSHPGREGHSDGTDAAMLGLGPTRLQLLQLEVALPLQRLGQLCARTNATSWIVVDTIHQQALQLTSTLPKPTRHQRFITMCDCLPERMQMKHKQRTNRTKTAARHPTSLHVCYLSL